MTFGLKLQNFSNRRTKNVKSVNFRSKLSFLIFMSTKLLEIEHGVIKGKYYYILDLKCKIYIFRTNGENIIPLGLKL